MKILITGGAGFIGSHLADSFIADGHQVLVADNLYTGSSENFKHHLENPSFEFMHHDVTLPFSVDVDAIFNLASPASPIHYQRFPVETIKSNILGSINLLELAKKLRIPIFQASTSEVYGDPAISPQPESYWGNVNPVGVRSCYDEGKRAAETLFMDYNRQYSIPIRIFRIFNTYGPRMSLEDGRVVSNFIVQALRGLPITIYGDGSQTRSFCYVDDLVHAFKAALGTEENILGPINIGNPNELSILEIAQKVIDLTNSNSQITFEKLPEDDPKQRKPDIEKAKRELGWVPKVGLDDGLIRTIDDFSHRIILD
jgi:UDP-glucuronate decarboxylase